MRFLDCHHGMTVPCVVLALNERHVLRFRGTAPTTRCSWTRPTNLTAATPARDPTRLCPGAKSRKPPSQSRYGTDLQTSKENWVDHNLELQHALHGSRFFRKSETKVRLSRTHLSHLDLRIFIEFSFPRRCCFTLFFSPRCMVKPALCSRCWRQKRSRDITTSLTSKHRQIHTTSFYPTASKCRTFHLRILLLIMLLENSHWSIRNKTTTTTTTTQCQFVFRSWKFGFMLIGDSQLWDVRTKTRFCSEERLCAGSEVE